MDNPIKFGTDGWRGIIAGDFTFDNVRVCVQAIASYIKEAGLVSRGLLIGYDTRFASEDFAAAAAEVVAANGIKVYLCSSASPTPTITYGVHNKKTGGAIIITASHNSGRWNGLKFKSEQASSAPPEVTERIEKLIAATLAAKDIKRLPFNEAVQSGQIEYFDPDPPYFEQLGKLIDLNELRQAGVKIVVDSMYGAGSGYFKRLLAGGAIELTEINGERNPLFPGIHPEPIAPNLSRLSERVVKEGAILGLATDGDADRLGIMDEKGRFITQLQVFALLALYMLEVRGERGAIVKTTTTTSMLYRLGEIFNVPVFETPVGFKYVAPVMTSENALIGGEESGGYGYRGHVLERDGILSGLYFLDLVVKTGKTPSELIDYLYEKVGPHHYHRVDIEFPEKERQAILKRLKDNQPEYLDGVKVAGADTIDGFRFTLTDTSWLLIRFSGTEPLLRIYAETDSPERVRRLLERGRELTGV